MFKDSGIQGKIAIVTGGARGIGREIVEVLAKEGAQVFFFYNSSRDLADSVVADSKQRGLSVEAKQVDVCDRTQCEQAINAIYEQTNRIDILVNNSGIVRDHLLMALSETDVREVLNTNVMGVFNVTSIVAPFMVSRRSGKIINISSVSAEKGGRGQTNYAASKGAINAFTKSLAVELARRKVTVNAVAPGVIETDMSAEVREMGHEETINKILLKRYGQPQDIAYTVAFLASKYSDYITGEVIHVDGGFKMD